MRILEDPSEISVGDMLTILRRPNRWDSFLNGNCPLSLKYPIEITVKKIREGYSCTAMTCGNYGWDLETIIEAGCYSNRPIDSIPKNWRIKVKIDNYLEINNLCAMAKIPFSPSYIGYYFCFHKNNFHLIEPKAVIMKDSVEIGVEDLPIVLKKLKP